MRLAAMLALAPLALSAAIVTQENDLYTVVPWFYTFYGSRVNPGIASQWIPYGTYTDGVGDIEYLRVSSNLVGVVHSAHDGFWERYWIPQGVRPIDMEDSTRYYPTTVTNETLRIIDLLNPADFMVRTGSDEESHEYCATNSSMLELRLAQHPINRHEGLAAGFGSRYLEELTGNTPPPLDTRWTQGLPYSVSDTNIWARVFPVYSALECDPHIWPSNAMYQTQYARDNLERWLYPRHLYDVWDYNGQTYDTIYGNYDDLTYWLRYYLPITNQIEHILARDPGWQWPMVPTNDYWTVTGPYIGSVKCERSGGSWASEEDARVWHARIANGSYSVVALVTYYGNSEWLFTVYGNAADGTRVDASATVNHDGTLAEWTSGGYTATKASLYDGENVFEHWANRTRRLDWTRLGIICQLERQMEITYKAREAEDWALLFTNVTMTQTRKYLSEDVELIFSLSNGPTGFELVELETDVSGLSYSEYTNILDSTGYADGSRILPTARGAASGFGELGGLISKPLYTTDEYLWYAAVDFSWEYPGKTVELFVDLIGTVSGGSPYEYYIKGEPGSIVVDGATNDVSSTVVPVVLVSIDETSSWSGTTKVSRVLSKSGEVHYTVFDESVVSNLAWEAGVWPTTNLWNDGWVSQVEIPNMEVMIACTDDVRVINSSIDCMYYPDLDANKVERFFRYDPRSIYVLSSHAAVENQRLASLRDLNAEVAARFAEYSGYTPADFAAAKIGGMSDVIAALDAADISTEVEIDLPLRLKIVATFPNGGEATIDEVYAEVSEGAWSLLHPVMYDGLESYQIAVLQLGLTAAAWTSNSMYRVDGHQNQMPKTLWRFRNLRDPSL